MLQFPAWIKLHLCCLICTNTITRKGLLLECCKGSGWCQKNGLKFLFISRQFELERLSGLSISNEADAFAAMKKLHDIGVETVILSSSEICTHEGEAEWMKYGSA